MARNTEAAQLEAITGINALISKYTADIPSPRTRSHVPTHEEPIVLLTGCTGNVGSHILASLLATPQIARVYTLDRSSGNPMDRLTSAFDKRGLPVDLLSSEKLVCYGGSIIEDAFGIPEQQYHAVKCLLCDTNNTALTFCRYAVALEFCYTCDS